MAETSSRSLSRTSVGSGGRASLLIVNRVAVVEVECSGTGRGTRKVGDGRAGDDAVIRLGRRRVRVVSC